MIFKIMAIIAFNQSARAPLTQQPPTPVQINGTTSPCLKKASEAKWRKVILTNAAKCGLEPWMVESIVRVESSYCKQTVNPKSTARGCMQVLKGTAGDKYIRLDHHEESIQVGVEVLCKFKKSFPNTFLMRYHVGNGKLEGEVAAMAAEYKKRLDPAKNIYFNKAD